MVLFLMKYFLKMTLPLNLAPRAKCSYPLPHGGTVATDPLDFPYFIITERAGKAF